MAKRDGFTGAAEKAQEHQNTVEITLEDLVEDVDAMKIQDPNNEFLSPARGPANGGETPGVLKLPAAPKVPTGMKKSVSAGN